MYGTVLRIGDLIRKMEMIGPKPLLVRGRREVRPHVFPVHWSVPTCLMGCAPHAKFLEAMLPSPQAVFRALLSAPGMSRVCSEKVPSGKALGFIPAAERQLLPKWRAFLPCPNHR